MTMRFVRKTLLAALAVGGVAAAASAQQPGATPQVVRWPGGYMVMNGPEVIVRQSGTGTSTTMLSGVGNGVGNKVVVSNGRAGGTTVITNSRLGFGNSIVIDDEEWLLDLPGVKCPPKPVAPVVPAVPQADPVLVPPQAVPVAPPVAEQGPPVYRGKANAFWSKKEWSDAHDCNVYFDPTSKGWYRYHKDDDCYKAIPPDVNK